VSHKPEPAQIAALREEMLSFATLQLRNNAQAEDAVHEAINAALATTKYRDQSKLRGWVFAILRNKIIDVIRDASKHQSESYIDDSQINDDEDFSDKGYWKTQHQPLSWGQPETIFAQQQFWTIFEFCLQHMPEKTARIFMMREHLGLEVDEICNIIDISKSNCWVIMHRARMQLRKCLEKQLLDSQFLQEN